MKNGSKSLAVTLSDGVATLRDSVLLILSNAVSYAGNQFVEGGLDVELQAAIVVVLFAAIKFGWKFFTDTQRVSAL